jgi:hypothetical protein
MRVFIAWSGTSSRLIAEALHDWIPRVIQNVIPWMSEQDIEKGKRWDIELSKRLQESKFGIVCLTPENLDSTWIHFESGALAKAIEESYVWTYLFRIEPAQVKPPLSQFQHTKAIKLDTRKLLKTINNLSNASLSDGLKDNILDDAFEKWWPDLETRLQSISNTGKKFEPVRPDRELLEELLQLVRQLNRQIVDTGKTKTGSSQSDFLRSLLSDVEQKIDSSEAEMNSYGSYPPDYVKEVDDLRTVVAFINKRLSS